MKRVIIESPLKGNKLLNRHYARACMLDCLMRGEAPFASHLLYDHPDILDDDKPEDRELGITAGFQWGEAADLVAVYTDLGISSGMERGIVRARTAGTPIEYRTLEEYNPPEEASLHRQDRLTEIGKFPLSYGILSVLLAPNKEVLFQSDGLALFEVLGLCEYIKVRMHQMMAMQQAQPERDPLDDVTPTKPN